jgi:nucleoside-diphosphate-sugar epimerase/predicted dehydrogenase
MNKIGITGASGFVGKHLVKKFIEDGFFVNVYARNPKSVDFLEERFKGKMNIFAGDINDGEKLDAFVKDSDIVVHLAAGTSGNYDAYFDTTVKGSALIFELCEKHKTKKLIYISSISVYDLNKAQKNIVVEETPFEPYMDLRGWYAKTKALGEQAITEKLKNSSLPTIIIRPGLVYAPNMKAPLMGCGIIRGGLGVNLGMGGKRIPPIHINDLYGAIRAAIESGVDKGDYNIVSDEQPTTRQMVSFYNKFAPNKIKIFYVPRIFFLFNHLLDGFLPKKSRIGRYNYLLTRTQKNIYYSAEKAKKELDWKAIVNFEETMREMVEFHTGPVSIGIVGCGFAFKTLHLPVIAQNPRIRVVAVFDVDKAAATKTKDDFFKEADVLEKPEDFGKYKLDFVVVSTPPSSRVALAGMLAEAGHNLMIEKPLALNLHEVLEIKRIAEKNRVRICVVNNYRFRKNVLALKSALRNDRPAVNAVAVKFWSGPVIQSAGSWREKMKDALLYEMAYHFIDLAVDMGGKMKHFDWLKIEKNDDGILTEINANMVTEQGKRVLADLKMFPSYAESFVEVGAKDRAYFAGFYPESFRIKAGSLSPIGDLKNTIKTIIKFLIDKKIKKDGNFSHRQIYNLFINSLKDDTDRIPVSVDDVIPTMELLEKLKKG